MKFWKELRRRRVYRLAGLYIVGAWVIIQVADTSFPAWGVPDSALRYLFYAAAACFPVALVFSWYYDITPRGIIRTESADRSESADLKLQRTDYLVLFSLFAIGFAVLFSSASKIQQEVESEPTVSLQSQWSENSIAVLPFTNLDTNPDTGYFSDGITEEILHRLSSLGALHVLASNSSFVFRDSQESPTQIREKLGVRYLLQGSIRRENDYVRIMARLIDEGGYQVWSESFERKLEGIFTIQTEIASTVASQIINEIVPLQELPAGRTTTNMEAYNEYLVGKSFFDKRTKDWRAPATTAFRKAIELDPGFAPPYAGLAMAISVMTGRGPHREEAKQLAEKAIELDTSFAGGHAALGLILMFEGKPEQASLSLRRALELNPSLGFAYNILAFTLETMDRVDEGAAIRQQGLAIDPLNPPLVANVADFESNAGNYGRAEQLLLRLLSLPNPPPLVYGELYDLYLEWGYFADAIAIAKQYVRWTVSSNDIQGADYLAWAYGFLGMTEEADYWMDLLFNNGQPDLSSLDPAYHLLKTRDADSELGVKLLQLVNQTEFQVGEHDPFTLAQFGQVNIQLGNYHKGSEQLEYGLRLYQGNADGTGPASSIDISALRASPDDIVFNMHLLAFAYQEVDRSDEADRILQALTDEFGMENNALHHALMGDADGALQALQTSRSTTTGRWAKFYGPGSYYEIVNEPAWAKTIKTPGFQKFLAEMKEDVDRQRAIVEAADAEHDFRAEFEALMAN